MLEVVGRLFSPYSRSFREGFAFALLFSVPLSACAASSERNEVPNGAVATVNGSHISVDDFRARYTQYLVRTGVRDDQRMRLNILQEMIADKLLVLDAVAEGIREEPEFAFRQEVVRRKLAIEFLTRRSVYDPIEVTEDDLADMFVRVNTRLKARHLYARTVQEAERLHARLQAGETFEDIAREVFSDSVLAENGGSVGFFDFDEMDPAFEDAAFLLEVGETSKPVQTALGYSIIQLEDRFTHPLLTESEFLAARKRLETYVLDRKRIAARQAFVREEAGMLDVSFDEASIDYLMRHIEGVTELAVEGPEPDWLLRPLVHFVKNGQHVTWSIGSFGEEAEMTDAVLRSHVRSRTELQDFILGVVTRHALVGRAERERLVDEPVFHEALQYEMERWIADQARERVSAQIAIPDDAVRAAYELHGGDLTYEESRDALTAALRRSAEKEAVQARVAALQRRYEVQVTPDRLASITLVQQGIN